MQYLSQTLAITIADEIAISVTMPYRYKYEWQKWQAAEKTHPAWNRYQMVRAGVSLAPIPVSQH